MSDVHWRWLRSALMIIPSAMMMTVMNTDNDCDEHWWWLRRALVMTVMCTGNNCDVHWWWLWCVLVITVMCTDDDCDVHRWWLRRALMMTMIVTCTIDDWRTLMTTDVHWWWLGSKLQLTNTDGKGRALVIVETCTDHQPRSTRWCWSQCVGNSRWWEGRPWCWCWRRCRSSRSCRACRNEAERQSGSLDTRPWGCSPRRMAGPRWLPQATWSSFQHVAARTFSVTQYWLKVPQGCTICYSRSALTVKWTVDITCNGTISAIQ